MPKHKFKIGELAELKQHRGGLSRRLSPERA
jgi:hypothetical protein